MGTENTDAPAPEAPEAADLPLLNTDPAPTEAPAPAEGTQDAPPEAEKPAETPPPEPPKAAEPEKAADQASMRAMAVLARREKAIRAQEAALKAQETEVARLKGLSERAKSDPLALLEASGVTLEALIDAHVAKMGDAPPPEVAKLTALEQQVAALQKAAEEAKQAAEQNALKTQLETARASVSAALEAAGDKYELTRALGADAVNEVLDLYLIQANSGEPISLDEAAARIESALEERFAPLRQTKKFGSKPVPPAPSKAPNGAQATSGAMTLTNRLQAEAPPRVDDDLPLDPDQRDAAILKSLKGGFFQ